MASRRLSSSLAVLLAIVLASPLATAVQNVKCPVAGAKSVGSGDFDKGPKFKNVTEWKVCARLCSKYKYYVITHRTQECMCSAKCKSLLRTDTEDSRLLFGVSNKPCPVKADGAQLFSAADYPAGAYKKLENSEYGSAGAKDCVAFCKKENKSAKKPKYTYYYWEWPDCNCSKSCDWTWAGGEQGLGLEAGVFA